MSTEHCNEVFLAKRILATLSDRPVRCMAIIDTRRILLVLYASTVQLSLVWTKTVDKPRNLGMVIQVRWYQRSLLHQFAFLVSYERAFLDRPAYRYPCKIYLIDKLFTGLPLRFFSLILILAIEVASGTMIYSFHTLPYVVHRIFITNFK